MKINIDPVSYIGKKDETTLNNTVSPMLEGEKVPLEKPMDKKLHCPACKQLHEYCHRKVCSDCIKKKIFYKYKNKTNYPEPEEIQALIKEGYNEKLKVDDHLHFNFHDSAIYPLPNCLYGYSWDLVHSNMKTGNVEFIWAKRHCKA